MEEAWNPLSSRARRNTEPIHPQTASSRARRNTEPIHPQTAQLDQARWLVVCGMRTLGEGGGVSPTPLLGQLKPTRGHTSEQPCHAPAAPPPPLRSAAPAVRTHSVDARCSVA
eukprot:243443-Chlamydomonas_euryale.AAC.1